MDPYQLFSFRRDICNLFGIKSPGLAFLETIEFLERTFHQGDSRYWEINGGSSTVAAFLEASAIVQEKIELNNIKVSKRDLSNIQGPQEHYKAVARKYLRHCKHTFIGYECPSFGRIVDILAKDQVRNLTIMVECGPCAIGKVVEYLEQERTVLWLFKPTVDSRKFELFIYERGTTWDDCYKKYKEYESSILREAFKEFI